MIKVNLLPTEIRKLQTQKSPNFWAGLVFGTLGVVCVTMYLTQMKTLKSLEADKAQLQNHLNLYQPVLAKLDELEAHKKTLEAKHGVIQQLERERLWYPVFFDHLTSKIPEGIWLTSLQTQSANGETMMVSCTATAFDPFAIADFVSNLEQAGYFSKIELGSITSGDSAGGGTVYQFQLTAVYRPQVS